MRRVFFTGVAPEFEAIANEVKERSGFAESCRVGEDWSCPIEGQYCPPDRAGSHADGYCCMDGEWGGTAHRPGSCNLFAGYFYDSVHRSSGRDYATVAKYEMTHVLSHKLTTES